MAIGHAVQRGTLIYIYDQNGRQVTSISAPKCWPEDGLKNYSNHCVSVQKGTLIYTYNEDGHQVGRPYPALRGNVEWISPARSVQAKVERTGGKKEQNTFILHTA